MCRACACAGTPCLVSCSKTHTALTPVSVDTGSPGDLRVDARRDFCISRKSHGLRGRPVSCTPLEHLIAVYKPGALTVCLHAGRTKLVNSDVWRECIHMCVLIAPTVQASAHLQVLWVTSCTQLHCMNPLEVSCDWFRVCHSLLFPYASSTTSLNFSSCK